MAVTSIRIEEDLRPAYYDDFHCVMGECRYNCCDCGWNIQFSKKDYLKVKRAPKSPELEELCGKSLRRLRDRGQEDFYGEFRPSGAGRCAFHTPEGLCRLQLECGEETLPKVCRIFPRAQKYMPSGYLERSLSPACEAVLALLWDLPEGIEFRSAPLPKDLSGNYYIKEEGSLPRRFSEVREWCIDVLQDRRFPLPQRIFLMGMGLRELADGEEDVGRWMERAASLPDSVDVSNVLPTGDRQLAMYLINCMRTLRKIKPVDADIASIVKELLEAMKLKSGGDGDEVTIPLAPYREAQARFAGRFGERDYFMENLMVSVFFYLHMPDTRSREDLWKGYVNFCNLYAHYRFAAVMSCREGAAGDREELFRLIVFISRNLLHGEKNLKKLRDSFFDKDSATLAHMAILLCG